MKVRTYYWLFWLFIVLPGFAPQSLGQSGNEGLLTKRLQAVKVDDASLHLALSEVASKYRIPIGLETSLDRSEIKEDRSEIKEGRVVVDMSEGTVEDLLNAIIEAAPGYQWRVVNGVVNVTPKQECDPLLENILATPISALLIKQGASRLSVRTALTDLPEVKARLETANLRPLNLALTSTDFRDLGLSFSLEMKGATVREILNQIIRTSDVKYWLVSRFGKSNEFLIINL